MFSIWGLTGKSLFNLLRKGLYLLSAVSLVLVLLGTEEAVILDIGEFQIAELLALLEETRDTEI